MVLLVNMIPNSLSSEFNQDSEPNITVNPANPLQIAASAFTPDPMGGPNAPIYESVDGGHTWVLRSIVPSQLMTGDITQSFSGTARKLYAGILKLPQPGTQTEQNMLRTTDFLSPAVMTVLEDTLEQDQPWMQATTVQGGADASKERFYVGYNDFRVQDGKTSTVGQSLDAGASHPAIDTVHIEKRHTSGQNGFQTRPTIHPDGTVYVAFYGWRNRGPIGRVTADVVVVRDDDWGAGDDPYTALVDTGDNTAGVRVARNVTFTLDAQIGQQRGGGDISIAVDPRNSSLVYLAFGDNQGSNYTLHVRRSTDRGVTWSSDLLVIANAINPALAINSNSEVALLYQQVTPTSVWFRNLRTGLSMRWETHLRRTLDGHAWSDLLLVTTPADRPPTGQPGQQGGLKQPYLGDYIYLMAVGRDFYGIFCANNTPDRANFPNGVAYQRNANFDSRTLLANDGRSHVKPSIDPFFLKVTESDGGAGSTSPTWTAPGTPPTPPVVM